MPSQLLAPSYAHNMRLLGYTDLGDRNDSVQVMVQRGHAYVGHIFSGGFTVVNVQDPRVPRPVAFVAAPPHTCNLHLQAHEDLLLVVHGRDFFDPASAPYDPQRTDNRNWSAGMAVYDISVPHEPRQIGFLDVPGAGLHRIWYVGGRYAYVSAWADGFSAYIMLIIDVADPLHPREAGRFWLPGMNQAAGELPNWPRPDGYYSLHHPIVQGTTAYCSWRDAGLAVVDVADPGAPRLLTHKSWAPPFGGGTHNALPLADRDLLIVVDEAGDDSQPWERRPIWVFDNRIPFNPVGIATFPLPGEQDYARLPGRFGPHNVHENRPGSFVSSDIIFSTYWNAGLRATDISDPYRPVEIGALVPAAPAHFYDPRPNRPHVLQCNDIFADRNGLLYLTDFSNGLNIVEFQGK
jgi:hypothetical protein